MDTSSIFFSSLATQTFPVVLLCAICFVMYKWIRSSNAKQEERIEQMEERCSVLDIRAYEAEKARALAEREAYNQLTVLNKQTFAQFQKIQTQYDERADEQRQLQGKTIKLLERTTEVLEDNSYALKHVVTWIKTNLPSHA